MKRAILILINCTLYSTLLGQTLTDQIEYVYSSIDSISYIDDMLSSYSRSLDNLYKESQQALSNLYCSGNVNVDERIKENDSICSEVYIISKNNAINDFKQKIKTGSPIYVLNLKLKDGRILQVDTGKLCFNLFFLDKKCKGRLYVYCDNGEYSWHDSRYRTFSKKLGQNAPKAFRKILSRHPKHILYCPELEGMNLIMYVLDDEIFVFRIIQMKEYKLDYYLKNMTLIKDS